MLLVMVEIMILWCFMGNLLGKNFLFTGDLEEEGEEQMMATYPNLPVDVLKAGHHGSKGHRARISRSHFTTNGFDFRRAK